MQRSCHHSWWQRRATLRLAEKKLADTMIRAPFAGEVKERMVTQGQYLRVQTPVMVIVALLSGSLTPVMRTGTIWWLGGRSTSWSEVSDWMTGAVRSLTRRRTVQVAALPA